MFADSCKSFGSLPVSFLGPCLVLNDAHFATLEPVLITKWYLDVPGTSWYIDVHSLAIRYSTLQIPTVPHPRCSHVLTPDPPSLFCAERQVAIVRDEVAEKQRLIDELRSQAIAAQAKRG